MGKKITAEQRADLEKLSAACDTLIAKHGKSGNTDLQEASKTALNIKARADKKLRRS
jgi:hypothetical protein